MIFAIKLTHALQEKVETLFTGATGIGTISAVTLLDVAGVIQYTLQLTVTVLTIYFLIKKNKQTNSHDKTTS
jgi:hypothetical protein